MGTIDDAMANGMHLEERREYQAGMEKTGWYHAPSKKARLEEYGEVYGVDRGNLTLVESPQYSRVMITGTSPDVERVAVPDNPRIKELGYTLLTEQNTKPHFDEGYDIVAGFGDFAVNPALARERLRPVKKRQPKITSGKHKGDDASSYAVFVGGKPAVTGLSRQEVSYHKQQIAKSLGVTLPKSKSSMPSLLSIYNQTAARKTKSTGGYQKGKRGGMFKKTKSGKKAYKRK